MLDKDVAKDMDIAQSQISKIRNGTRLLSDKEILFLAKGARLKPELVFAKLNHERTGEIEIKKVWKNIINKYECN